MTSIIPISNKTHLRSKFSPITSFEFAKNKNLCEILMDECSLVAAQSPIVFAKNDTKKFIPCCVLGLLPKQNVFISKSGQWKTDYVPAVLRTYPFSLVKADKEKLVLCIDNTENMLSNDNSKDGFKLFNEDGSQSTYLSNALRFLASVEEQRQKMSANVDLISSLDILEEWPINVESEQEKKKLKGFWKVNRNKFLNLDKETFYELRENSILDLIFAHFFSLRNIEKISKMAEQDHKNPTETRLSLRDQALDKQKAASALELDSLVKNLLLDD